MNITQRLANIVFTLHIPPPSGAVGLRFALLGRFINSLLAGHVGNIEGSSGRGSCYRMGRRKC